MPGDFQRLAGNAEYRLSGDAEGDENILRRKTGYGDAECPAQYDEHGGKIEKRRRLTTEKDRSRDKQKRRRDADNGRDVERQRRRGSPYRRVRA